MIRNSFSTKQLLLFITCFSLVILTSSCLFSTQYSLEDFFFIEGKWTYQRLPQKQNWSITRKVLKQQKQDSVTWYQVEEQIENINGSKTTDIIWYARINNTIFMKTSESDDFDNVEQRSAILKAPEQQLESIYEQENDLPKTSYEKSVYISEISEKKILEFSCPGLETNTSQVWIRGGSLDMSLFEKKIYAKNIGMIVIYPDFINSPSKKDILMEYQIGKVRIK